MPVIPEEVSSFLPESCITRGGKHPIELADVSIAVVIPCRDEEAAIARVIRDFKESRPGRRFGQVRADADIFVLFDGDGAYLPTGSSFGQSRDHQLHDGARLRTEILRCPLGLSDPVAAFRQVVSRALQASRSKPRSRCMPSKSDCRVPE